MATSNMVVQNNILALNTHRNMKNVGIQQSKASEKLSSGFRINRAADDATGLAISEKMRAQIKGLNMASKNVSDAISLIATAEGGMQGVDDMLHRIRELVDFAANDTNENNKTGTGDRDKIQDEINALVAEIDDMSNRVEFNKKKLIDGSFQDTKAQLATAKAVYDRTDLEVVNAEAQKLGVLSQLGDIDAVNAAKKTARADLSVLQTAYTDAKAAVENALGAGNTLADLTINDVNGTGDAILSAGDEIAFGALLKTYSDAAKALGVDELDLGAVDTAGVTYSTLETLAGGAGSLITAADAMPTSMIAATATPVAGKGIDTYQQAVATAEANLNGTAYGDLNAAQATLDGTGTGSVAEYKLAVAAMSPAQATYDGLVKAYNDAKAAFSAEIERSGKTLSNLRATDLDGSGTNIGNMSDFQAKLQAYNKAAKDLGIDELNLGQMNAGAVTQLETNLGVAAGTLITSGDGYGTDWNTAQGSKLKFGAGIDNYQQAVTTFAAAEQTYKNAVSVRDAAQTKVDSLTQQMSDAQKNLNAAQTRFSAAGISYTAAQELDNANQSKALHFQVGSNANQSLVMSIGSLKSNTLGIGDGKGNSYINVIKDSGQDITATLDVIDQALSYVTAERSKLGAAQNRMEYTQQSLDITSENISDAESRIRDTDMAKEMMNFTKANILQQVSVSMMAQANQVPQGVLQLLR